jgi:hypothetical protein
LEAVVATGSVDRHRTAIDVVGVSLENYRRNPIVLWAGGSDPARGSVPIGRCISVDKAGGDRIVAEVQFAADKFADRLFGFYKDGTLNAWEASVLPSDESRPTAAEIRANKSLAKAERIVRRSELLAISAVGVPGNSMCLTIGDLTESDHRELRTLVQRGLWSRHQVCRATASGPLETKAGEVVPPLGRVRPLEEIERDALAMVAAWRRSISSEIAELAVFLKNHR